jgi:hypothetical protein
VIFKPHSHSLAELVIPPTRTSGFGVRTTGKDPERHDIGADGAPRWRLSLSYDDWELETLPPGRSADEPLVPEELEWQYLEWAEGSRAENGFSTLPTLPTGRYYVVRSDLNPRREKQVLLGNGRLPTPDNMLTLLDRTGSCALAIGARPGEPPALAQPLLGLAVVNYTIAANDNGILFFAVPDPDSPQRAPEPAAVGDLVLVVPVTGELVLDTRARWDPNRPTESQLAWTRTGALEFARLLKGSPPSRKVEVS